MRGSEEDSLLCDFVQYYGITDYKQLPVETQAVLTFGLPPESRTIRKITGIPCSTEVLLLAGILDQLRFQSWSRTKGAKTGRNKPKSILAALVEQKDKDDEIMRFSSGEDYESYRAELLRR